MEGSLAIEMQKIYISAIEKVSPKSEITDIFKNGDITINTYFTLLMKYHKTV